jgi:hypothetical protein
VEWVKVEKKAAHYQIDEPDLGDKENPWRLSSAKVAKAIMDLYLERTGPLSSRDVNSTI